MRKPKTSPLPASHYLDEVLTEMHRRVNATYTSVDALNADPEWYTRHEWTRDQEYDFIDWLTDYFRTNDDARESLTTVLSRNKLFCNKAAREFVGSYGWTLKY